MEGEAKTRKEIIERLKYVANGEWGDDSSEEEGEIWQECGTCQMHYVAELLNELAESLRDYKTDVVKVAYRELSDRKSELRIILEEGEDSGE